jgi:hypothetical protein
LTEKYETGTSIHRENETSSPAESTPDLIAEFTPLDNQPKVVVTEKKQKVEKPEFDLDYIALYILDQIYGLERCEKTDPLLGEDFRVSRENMKKAFGYIVDNYEKVEERVSLPYEQNEE